jgi:hypothetical protein
MPGVHPAGIDRAGLKLTDSGSTRVSAAFQHRSPDPVDLGEANPSLAAVASIP